MKKEIKASDIIIRLLLLFMWPYGLIPLALSKRFKHKVSFAFIYFALCCLIGLPLFMFIFTLGEGTATAIEWVKQWWSEYFFFCISILAISLPIYFRKTKKDKVLAEQTSSEDVNKKVEDFGLYQQATSSSDKDRSYSTEYNTKLYGVDYQSNNNQYNPNNAYQKAQVLTEREKNFYETIRLIAEKHNLNVSAKMRLADIVNVSDDIQKKSSLWRTKFGQISQKHIDFALQDKTNLEIKLLIEIDDYTHQRADRIERDKFVDSVCKQANIPILHLYDVIGLEDKIVNILHSEKVEQEM